MNAQRKILDRIRKNRLKGLPLSRIEIAEAMVIIEILDEVSDLGYTRDSLPKMFNGHPDYPPESGIIPYKGKMYELKGTGNKGVFHIRIGNHSAKNRIRFRWQGKETEILGIGDFHSKFSKSAN